MTLPDPSLDRPGGDDLGQIDRLPPSERNQDELRTETSHGLAQLPRDVRLLYTLMTRRDLILHLDSQNRQRSPIAQRFP